MARGVSTADTSVLDAEIVVDQHHPSLFDHPLDHIPGAVIFEAFRQTAVVAAHELFGLSPQRLVLTTVRATFLRFGELELATRTRAQPLPVTGDHTVEFSIEMVQGDAVITEGLVALRRPGRAPMPGVRA
ncbi:AfsA-related hotdog domain-containing protein [Nocardia sp. CC201C]|uniref:AfsA-related hotdog domain-containing protein n=1 Tax=Nocardia sp. CC201C TaxID=3044575 RepID=UPI0024A83FC5|nr:AfsA-related hotdog domain-containing protein [Nocardia sp. CC201C]